MPTIAHISDLHLQSGTPERQAQVEPILQKINAMKPDLVVISGDVTDDGWDSIEELKWAKGWLEKRIEGDWFAVPGNHDVGNFVTLPEGMVTSQRIQNWNEVFNERHLRKLNSWTVVGINSMLAGSGLPEEQLQLDWLETESDELAYVADCMFFGHSPLTVAPIESMTDFRQPTNPEIDYWIGPAEGREVLWHKLNKFATSLYGTGHVHQTRVFDEGTGRSFAWAPPASGTWVHAPGLPNPPMPERTGFFLHTLHDDGRVESELFECAPMLKLYEHNPWP